MILPLKRASTAFSALAAIAQSPSVTIQNGTVIGNTTFGAIDNFWGIPYAKAPVGDLRLRPPQILDAGFGTLTLPSLATDVAACIQMSTIPPNISTIVPNEDAQQAYEGLWFPPTSQSEDCLSVNIQRPTNTTSDAKLPVLFWIFGGGWETGSTQPYDATEILLQSLNMSEPFIFVAPNYRVSGFGFLQGKELSEEGSSNLGLRDQRLALEWVQDNIGAFGGDPSRVSIWGESSGSASVFDHLLINNGDNTYRGNPLFRGAMMNSGTIIPTLDSCSDKAQYNFDVVAEAAGCRSTNDVLGCLRNVSVEAFTNATNALPSFAGPGSLNVSYIRRPDPLSDFYANDAIDALKCGKYAKVPVIMTNMASEASIFTPQQYGIINSTETLVDFFSTWWPMASRDLVEQYVSTYSEDPAAGFPVNTGNQYEIYPESKRNGAIQSDFVFIMGRRIALSYMADQVNAWSSIATFEDDLPYFGTYHTSDLGVQFGLAIPGAGGNMNAAYINFINTLDPNGDGQQWWPKYDPHHRIQANFGANSTSLTGDSYRWESYEFLKNHADQLKF